MGYAEASYSRGTQRTLAVEAKIQYVKHNAELFLHHNVQFLINIITRFTCYNLWFIPIGYATFTHTYILGDGEGYRTTGGGSAPSDHWITVLPGEWNT